MMSIRLKHFKAVIDREIYRADTLNWGAKGPDVWMNSLSLESPNPACYSTSPRPEAT
jgi:hypothetical protein